MRYQIPALKGTNLIMNTPRTRREFLAEVGRGMLVATVGCEVAGDLGLSTAWAADDTPLSFGSLEPLWSV